MELTIRGRTAYRMNYTWLRYLTMIFACTIACTMTVQAAPNPRVFLQTEQGAIVIELFPREAPLTVKHFLEYVDGNFYNGTQFHRIVPGFFIQGGEFTDHFEKKRLREAVKNEASNGLKNEYQSVAMAHETNAEANAQFLINLKNNSAFNGNRKTLGFTVFGKVIEGMDVAEAIALQPRGMHGDFPEAPNTPIHIIKAERIDSKTNLDSKLTPKSEADLTQNKIAPAGLTTSTIAN